MTQVTRGEVVQIEADPQVRTKSEGDLVGRTALVVGASRGIGAAIAVALANQGANVGIVARSEAALDHVADKMREGGARVEAMAADVADPGAANRAVAQTAATFGSVDVLVYAAGQSAVGRFEDLEDADWTTLYEINVMGAVRFARAALPRMRDQGWGRIINIASTAAKYGSLYQSPYNASKHAMLGFTRCLALEVAQTGITVNAICPGFVDTEMVDAAIPQWGRVIGIPPEDVVPTLLGRVPIRRMLQPEEVATLAAYVASPKAGGVTGQGLTVDGGLILI